jgi:hypothetical protein
MVRENESGFVNDTTFVVNTGATSHMVNSKKYLTDILQITSEITTGNEEQFQCTNKGIYKEYFKNKHGKDITIILTDVLWLSVNLFSITKCITKHGVKFTADKQKLIFEYIWQ